MACKLVIVAWLKSLWCHDETEGSLWNSCHGDAARHALVLRLLTKYLYQVTPLHRFVLKFSPWKCSGVPMGNPQWVDAEGFSQGKQEEVVLEEERMTWS